MSRNSRVTSQFTASDVTPEHIEAGCRLAFLFLSCCRPEDAADLLHGLNILSPGHELVSRLLVFALLQLEDKYACSEEARVYLRRWPKSEHRDAVYLMQCYAGAMTGGGQESLHTALQNWREAC